MSRPDNQTSGTADKRPILPPVCSGCGLCAGVCPRGNLHMGWDRFGQRVPVQTGQCPPSCGLCLRVCPFGADGPNEDLLAADLYGRGPGVARCDAVGYYLHSYVGYVAAGKYRQNGASGGAASWFLASLLERGMVDKVACVVPTMDPENLFTFALTDDPQTVRGGAKSAYYPVDVAAVVREMLGENGRYAAIGLPCFVKALRLAGQAVPRLSERLVCVAGLVCGQLKSRLFAEYLARSAGVARNEVEAFSFRDKVPDRPASNFDARVTASGADYSLPWSGSVYSEAWGTGQFKPEACDLCDDVFAETADIVFMDAWLPDYSSDPRGTSIVVTRSPLADELIRSGIEGSDLALTALPIKQVVRSQAGVLYSKRRQLSMRLWLRKASGTWYPPKRVGPARPNWVQRWQIMALEAVRQTSHQAMARQAEADPRGLNLYSEAMRGPLARLRRANSTIRLLGGLRACVHSLLKGRRAAEGRADPGQ